MSIARPRSSWGARSAWGNYTAMGKVGSVFVHHSVTRDLPIPNVVKDIQDVHWNKTQRGEENYIDIAYNFVVTTDGRVWEGRGWGVRQGATSSYWNSRSYAICVAGNFHPNVPNIPTTGVSTGVITGVAAIIGEGVELGHVTKLFKVRGHRDAYATACPGDHLYARLGEIAALVKNPEPEPLSLEDRVARLERRLENTRSKVIENRVAIRKLTKGE